MPKSPSPYDFDLDKNAANFQPLTPLGHLERAAWTYPDRVSVIHGAKRFTWKETHVRAHKLADALAKRGIGKGDTVAVLTANTPEMMEMHFGKHYKARRRFIILRAYQILTRRLRGHLIQ